MEEKQTILLKRRIPIRYTVDVFVAGGGPAGIAAALAAARCGSSVYLAEAQNTFGGLGTAGLVPMFMEFTDGVNFLADGIGREVLERLKKEDGIGMHAGLPIRVEALKRVYDEMLEESDVQYSLMTNMVAVDLDDDGKVSSVILSAKSGLFAVRAKIYIDCTGDGDLAVQAGAQFEKGDADGNMMGGTLCSLWAEIDWDHAAVWDQELRAEEGYRDGVLSVNDRHVPGMIRMGEHTAAGNIGHAFGVDGTDERSLTRSLMEQRKRLVEYTNFYRKYVAGFEKAELLGTAGLLGIRETRRITGDYSLCLDDFMKRAVFDDEIGRYSYCVDIHESDASDEENQKFVRDFNALRYQEGESYGIPYRILTPKGLKNVLVAGRCVSCDRYLQGSIRVMPGCFITGQAAGAAASIASKQNCDIRGFDISLLQKRLISLGGYLPNFKPEPDGK